MLLQLLLVALLASVAYGNVQQQDVQFFLTNANTRMQEIRTASIANLNLDRTKEVKIVSHGWVDNADSFWYGNTKDNYVRRGNANIIALDWSRHASTLYSISVRRLPDVAYFAALMILELSDTQNIPLSNFHLIGHSLGAHLFGFAGQYVQLLTGEKVGRITGLDPARPSFQGNDPDDRLSDDDADFVDVLHTDADTLGYSTSIGHVDYYPNGGKRQNGCGLILTSSCSHGRAPTYFYESINHNSFVATACSSYNDFSKGNCGSNQRIVMGEKVDRSARGDFFLDTASSAPFGLGYV